MIEGTTTDAARHGMNGENRSLGSIIAEIKEEATEFLNTRVQVMKAELQETIGAAKTALPLALLGLALFWIALLLFTAAAVVVVATAFAGHVHALFFAFLIVGVLWVGFSGTAFFFAYNAFRSRSRFPQRTVQVLKADKVWLQTEARSHS